MSIDAVVLLRVRSRALLKKRLEGVSNAAQALEPLDDGAVLWSTFVRFPRGEEEVESLRLLLTRVLGDAMKAIHDDERGIFVVPDVCEPRGRTYDAVVAEVAEAGMWLPGEPLSDEAIAEHDARMLADIEKISAIARAAAGGQLPEEPEELDDDEDEDVPDLDVGDLSALMERAAHGVKAAIAAGLVHGCFLVRPGATVAVGDGDVGEIGHLADGSVVIVTTRIASDDATFGMILGGHPAWTEGHDDARGVLVFDRSRFAAVCACPTYDAAVAALPPRWVQPTTLEDLITERAAAGRRYLDGS